MWSEVRWCVCVCLCLCVCVRARRLGMSITAALPRGGDDARVGAHQTPSGLVTSGAELPAHVLADGWPTHLPVTRTLYWR